MGLLLLDEFKARPLIDMFRKILLYLIFSFLSIAMYSQNHETVIKTQAMEMAKAMLKKDYDNFIKYAHPKLVELGGGKEKMRPFMDTLTNRMKSFGAEIKKITIGHPYKVIAYKKELQSTLPQTTEVSFLSGFIIVESTLIAISQDGGKNWYFIDTNFYGEKKLKEALPDLSPELVIPPQKRPRIVNPQTQSESN